MNETAHESVIEVKKYPNRRFYDVSRSRHVTLADLYEVVRGGRRILVKDSKTGEDITNVVLTQIILEHDPPKLDLFPAALLHQTIQSNQQVIRRFIDQYFTQAMEAFVGSQKQFDDYLKRSGFSAMSPTAPFDWVRMLFPGMGGGSNGAAAEASPAAPISERSDAPVAALREEITSLRREVDRVRVRARKPTRKKKARRKRG